MDQQQQEAADEARRVHFKIGNSHQCQMVGRPADAPPIERVDYENMSEEERIEILVRTVREMKEIIANDRRNQRNQARQNQQLVNEDTESEREDNGHQN